MIDFFKNIFPSYKSLTKEHGWTAPDASTADRNLLPNLSLLQNQSSDLVRNEAVGSAILNALTEGAIGSGLKPEPNPDYDLLGISEKEAQAWSQRAEKLFSIWANTNESSICKSLNFNDMEKLVFRSTLEFGDTLVIRREQKNSPFPLCLHLVEGTRLETPTEKEDDFYFKKGVQLSKHTNETIAYHIKNEDWTFKRIAKNDQAGNSQATLVKNTKRISQTRGEPLLALVSPLIKVLGRYIQGEIDISAMASYVAFVTKTQDGNSVLPNYGVVSSENNKQQDPPTKIKPNSVVNLAPGEDISMLDPKRPSSSFESFTSYIISLIATEVGLPGEVLLKKFDSSYSASRAAILQAHQTYKSRRHWITRNFHNNVWNWFISSCVSQGILSAPGFFNNKIARQAWLKCGWIGEGALQIDPTKEADGYKKLFELGVTSKQAICKSMGTDYESIKTQLEKEKQHANN